VRERYTDFGPALAAEKLTEIHGLSLSVETLRKWVRESGLWTSRMERWFEERGPRCTLLVFVDDATGRLMQLYFARKEHFSCQPLRIQGRRRRDGVRSRDAWAKAGGRTGVRGRSSHAAAAPPTRKRMMRLRLGRSHSVRAPLSRRNDVA
jgi:hypothetical protein